MIHFFKTSFNLILLIVGLFFVGCSAKINAPQSEEQKKVEASYSLACSKGTCPCSSPLGPIVDGGTAIAYKISEVSCGETCQPKQVVLKCKNGAFDQDMTKFSFSCQVKACKDCIAGNNQVPHGFTVQMFNKASVSCGLSCDDSKRALVCRDGKLQGNLTGPSSDGKDTTFSFATCSPSTCSCDIPGGGKMTVGGTMKFYKSANGTCDVPCEAVTNQVSKTCIQTGEGANAVFAFNGNAAFTQTSCLERPTAQCGCKLPDAAGTNLPHGTSQDLFTSSTLSNCNRCENIKIKAFCDAGSLYDKPATDTTRKLITAADYNSHRFLSCDSNSSPDCYVNSICIKNSESKTLYGKSSLTCADDPRTSTALFACSAATLLKNGTSYIADVDPFKLTWQESVPSNACVGCALPWGGSVAAGAEVLMFKSSVNSSNTCGTGCKQYTMKCVVTGTTGKFASGDAAIDADFEANKSSYMQTCMNRCTQEGGGAPPRFCLLPWQNSFVSADSVIPMYSRKTVEAGDSCQNYFKLGRCMLSTGTFDAGVKYIYKSCTELPSRGISVTSVTPKYTVPAGGAIALSGTGFASGMTIKIGKLNCASVTVTNATQAACMAPAGSVGSFDVLVNVAGKKAVLPGGFSYYSGKCTSGPGTSVFKFTGSNQTFAVPAGCDAIVVHAWGAGGGGRQNWDSTYSSYTALGQVGGAGGYSSGTIAVTPGSTMAVIVGSGGSGGNNQGSAGGGYSGIFKTTTVNQANALVIAGGGGGAGNPEGCNKGGTGGEGGGTAGGTHGDCSGLGGTQTAGGVGGASSKPGIALAGGISSTSTTTNFGGGGNSPSYAVGGGGGGGYFGGGAGSDVKGLAGSGGGGSGFLAPTVTNPKSETGSGRNPPQTSNPFYIFGAGIGGSPSTGFYQNSPGGPGYIVISY